MENFEQHPGQDSRASGQKLARIQNQVASAIRQTADMLSLPREHEGATSELKRFGVQTRAWIENTAGQIENIDPDKIKKDLTERIQRSPGTSLLTAAAVGLVLGILVVRRR